MSSIKLKEADEEEYPFWSGNDDIIFAVLFTDGG